ncbi:MAG TPA: efflux RND transporter periplasmic adaptor subunit, partial [Verrucomicrobiae bacterium]|nr:efflux RND transporter periplasmic adaptor subunit [Verrucomicrobiae bacterium]
MANPKKRGKFIIISIVIVVPLALGLYFAFKKKELPVVVQTVKVAKRNITEIVVASGKIQPVIEVHISPEVSGEIIEMPV